MVDLTKFGTGFENVTQEELNTNFLIVTSDMHNQVKDGSVGAGNFFLTGSFESLGKEIEVVPVCFIRSFVHFSGPKGEPNSTFMGEYSPEVVREKLDKGELFERSFGNIINQQGHQINENYKFVLHIVGKDDPAVFTADSTKISPAKDWLTRMRSMRVAPDTWLGKQNKAMVGQLVPMFLQRWKLKVVSDVNKKAQTFYNIGSRGTFAGSYAGVVAERVWETLIAPIKEQEEQYRKLRYVAEPPAIGDATPPASGVGRSNQVPWS